MSTLLDLLADYARLKERLDDARGRTGDRASRPFPPATPGEIADLERRLGGALPASYHAFLEQHDGWARFWGAMWLAGATGEARRHVDDQLRHWKRHVPLGSPDHADLEIEGKRYWVIGADDNGGFLALGEARAADGERPVLDVPRGFVENEWPSFLEFVRAQHRFRGTELEQLAEAANDPPAVAQDRPTIRVRTLEPIAVADLDDAFEAPADKPVQKAANKKPVQKAANKKPVQKAANKKPVQKAATKKPVQKAATKKPVQKAATKKPVRKAAKRASRKGRRF
jgi:hypothetical protein